DVLRLLPEVIGDREKCIVIAVAAGKNNDTKFHDFVWGGTFILAGADGAQATASKGNAALFRGSSRFGGTKPISDGSASEEAGCGMGWGAGSAAAASRSSLPDAALPGPSWSGFRA